MFRNRSGYTITEMIVVLVIFAVVTSLSIPRLHAATSSAGLRSARTQTAIYLAQAHALAVQRGREARFVRTGNSVLVTVDSSGTQVEYGRPHDLLVALAIVSIGVFGLAGGATLVTRLMGGGTVQSRAATIANAHIEQLRAKSCSTLTSGADTVRSVISTWTVTAVSVSGTARGASIVLTVQYPTTKGMRSQVYNTILPC